MSYTSIVFALFTAITIIVYFGFPIKKYQWTVLLVAGAIFYLWFSIKYSIFILLTIISIYLASILMDNMEKSTKKTVKENKEVWTKEEKSAFKKRAEGKRKCVLAIALFFNFGILALLKYFGEPLGSIAGFLGVTGEDGITRVLMPLGISFYTFQSTGYLIDCYRGNVEPEKNIFKLSLFISYFPQIVQGPIGQFEKLHHQLIAEHRPEWMRFKLGGELILWGLFKKLIIADRAVIGLNHFYDDPSKFNGTGTLIIACLYAIQLYADFSGGIDISRGISQVLGIDLAQNFRRPYFATSINDYWRRWHITLGEWMRNYVFYSLAVSGPFLKLGRKVNKALPTAIASFIVFILVGIWHGSNSKYIAFGVWNGALVALSVMLAPVFSAITKKIKIKVESLGFRFYQMVRTFILVLIGYYFDIAQNFRHAMEMLKATIIDQQFSLFKEQLKLLELSKMDYLTLFLACLVLFYVSIRLEIRDKDAPGELLSEKSALKQWIAILIGIILILVFGWYGPGYNAADFVYMQF